MPNTIQRVEEYIRVMLPETIRECPTDESDLICLPRPYIVPCARGAFQELYYWDTFFALTGLSKLRPGLARDCAEDFMALIERYRFIPNGSRTHYLNRSQPPYFAMLAKMVWDCDQDAGWLARTYDAIAREYKFWMTQRRSTNGLNHYGHHAADEEVLEFFEGCCVPRLGIEAESREEKMRHGAHTLAEAESGWDFNPRFEHRCLDYNPVDLNSNLYLYETLMAKFAGILETGEMNKWQRRATERAEAMRKLMWSQERGVYLDYDHVNARHSPVLSAASYHPLWAGIANTEEATRSVEALGVLEKDWGIVCCEEEERERVLQWDAPNGWAPLHYIAIHALLRTGHEADARRVAGKYVEVVSRCFEETGDLWEKYNVVTGNMDVSDEYEMPRMLGWTAGVFMDALRVLS